MGYDWATPALIVALRSRKCVRAGAGRASRVGGWELDDIRRRGRYRGRVHGRRHRPTDGRRVLALVILADRRRVRINAVHRLLPVAWPPGVRAGGSAPRSGRPGPDRP